MAIATYFKFGLHIAYIDYYPHAKLGHMSRKLGHVATF